MTNKLVPVLFLVGIYRKYKFQSLIVALLFLILNFCNPVWRTRYEYKQPIQDSEKNCASQCKNTEQLCEQMEDIKYQQCKSKAEEERDRHYKEKGTYSTYVSGFNCRRTNICTINYNECFKTCGGEIITISECTENCDDIPLDKRVI